MLKTLMLSLKISIIKRSLALSSRSLRKSIILTLRHLMLLN
jgi:hypothetical protein